MFKFIDDFLNNITMYRLVLYYLIVLLLVALGLSAFGFFSFNVFSLVISTVVLVGVGWITNQIFAYIFEVPANAESIYITTLILVLIITPVVSFEGLGFLFWAGVWASASKFIFAIKRKHIFNPAALSVFLTSLVILQSASWWVGTRYMLPAVLIGGLLIMRKTRREDMLLSFFVTGLISIVGFAAFKNISIVTTIQKALLDSPIIFFGFVMLTEPLTTPPTKILQIIYGGLVGFLFNPYLRLSGFSTTPELSLLIGNIFSYIVSPKEKLILKLKQKIQLSPDIYDFVFSVDQKFNFIPGQYMEWTLGHTKPDTRGNRRFLTIASSPSENTLRIGVKFDQNSSSYKKALLNLPEGGEMIASQLAGEFTLPKDESKKLVFIAGGIGVTPFRSMIKYLIDTNQKKDIVLLFSNVSQQEIVYRDVLDAAQKNFGLKVVYINTDTMGHIDEKLIQEQITDFAKRLFYISGSHNMVSGIENTLHKLGIKGNSIKTDFFPGYV